ncbi:MAG: tetratricopeptide repeat protein, partial [Bacteroidota bacterium]
MRNLTKLILLLVCLMMAPGAHAQMDSLTAITRLYGTFDRFAASSDLEQFEKDVDSLYAELNAHPNLFIRAQVNNVKGIVHFQQTEMDTALKYWIISRDQQIAYGKKGDMIVQGYGNVSLAYRNMGRHDEAIEECYAALRYADEHDVPYKLPIYSRLSSLFGLLKQRDKELYYLKKEYVESRLRKISINMASSAANLGDFYTNRWQEDKVMDESYPDSIIHFGREAWEIARRDTMMDFMLMGKLHMYFGNFLKGNYAESRKHGADFEEIITSLDKLNQTTTMEVYLFYLFAKFQLYSATE